MTTAAFIITVLTLVVVPANMTAQWFISKGKLKIAYPLLIIVYSLYMVIETYLALRDIEQVSILLFNIVNAWAAIMAWKGMRRIQGENKEKK
ncbi:MAG: hypothetical protein WC761_01005 [Candidatus Paceibacterota bacterium]|jgi:protein-S-isoprenylcysteine O-methyltransferase Ste14